jgi:hypothetical protein
MMKDVTAALSLTASLIFASALVELHNTAGMVEFATLAGATAIFAALTLHFIKD